MRTTYFETDLADLGKSVTNGIRAALGLGGLLALIIGVLMLIRPGATADVLVGIIAVYAAIAGLVNLAIGIFSRRLGVRPRLGYLALGALFLVAAVVSFANLSATREVLALLLGIMVGAVWIVEGFVGLTMVGDAPSKTWTIIYSFLSIIAGIVVVTSPLWGAAMLWLLLGLSLVILGITQLVRALRFGGRIA